VVVAKEVRQRRAPVDASAQRSCGSVPVLTMIAEENLARP